MFFFFLHSMWIFICCLDWAVTAYLFPSIRQFPALNLLHLIHIASYLGSADDANHGKCDGLVAREEEKYASLHSQWFEHTYRWYYAWWDIGGDRLWCGWVSSLEIVGADIGRNFSPCKQKTNKKQNKTKIITRLKPKFCLVAFLQLIAKYLCRSFEPILIRSIVPDCPPIPDAHLHKKVSRIYKLMEFEN